VIEDRARLQQQVIARNQFHHDHRQGRIPLQCQIAQPPLDVLLYERRDPDDVAGSGGSLPTLNNAGGRGGTGEQHVAVARTIGLRDLGIEQNPETRPRIPGIGIGQRLPSEDRRCVRRTDDDAREGDPIDLLPVGRHAHRRAFQGGSRVLHALHDQRPTEAGLGGGPKALVSNANLVRPKAEQLQGIGIEPGR